MHLDSGNSPDDMDIHLVCELTAKYGLGGRVAVGHGCKYSTLPPRDLRLLAAKIADAGVAVTVLPATDLYMMAGIRITASNAVSRMPTCWWRTG